MLTMSHEILVTGDSRLKSNLVFVGDAVDKLSRLHGYTYDRIDMPGRRYAGLLAQDVARVLPEAVYVTAPNNTLAVSYGSVSALLVEALNDLVGRVAALELQLRDGDGASTAGTATDRRSFDSTCR